MTPEPGSPGPRASEPQTLPQAPWLRRFPVRTPTLPPATHTNVYVVGEGDLLVVDPASPYPDEQERLSAYLRGLAAEGHRTSAIFLTHHHYDHIAGAEVLQKQLGVPVLAHPETLALVSRHLRLSPGRPVAEGERLAFGASGTGGLRALHTPGHAPGHLCLLDHAGANAIVGDMVASVGTIVIDPDDAGDMGVYLGSLGRLRRLGPLRLWPAHGAAVEDGPALLDFYVRHRLEREARVVRALSAGAGPLAVLVGRAYDDVPAAVHGLAERSLLAHLRKLQAEGRAAVDDAGVWRALP